MSGCSCGGRFPSSRSCSLCISHSAGGLRGIFLGPVANAVGGRGFPLKCFGCIARASSLMRAHVCTCTCAPSLPCNRLRQRGAHRSHGSRGVGGATAPQNVRGLVHMHRFLMCVPPFKRASRPRRDQDREFIQARPPPSARWCRGWCAAPFVRSHWAKEPPRLDASGRGSPPAERALCAISNAAPWSSSALCRARGLSMVGTRVGRAPPRGPHVRVLSGGSGGHLYATHSNKHPAIGPR
jgi:hypothetical protein